MVHIVVNFLLCVVWVEASRFYFHFTHALSRLGYFFTLKQVQAVMREAPRDLRAQGWKARPCSDGTVRWHRHG